MKNKRIASFKMLEEIFKLDHDGHAAIDTQNVMSWLVGNINRWGKASQLLGVYDQRHTVLVKDLTITPKEKLV